MLGGLCSAAAFGDARSRINACPHARTPATQVSAQTMRDAIVCLVNQERKRFHLPLLHENSKLDHSAQAHTDDMVRHSYFAHNSQNGADPGKRISAAGYHWSWWGENIATGYPTPASVMRAWMSDIGHCQNILLPQFADIGVGVNPHGIKSEGTGPSTWTQDFGLRSGANPPSHNSKPANGCPHGI
jgi:uncharacterized protein YkwD